MPFDAVTSPDSVEIPRDRAMDILDRDRIEHVPAFTVFKWIFLVAVNLCVPYQILMGLLGLTGLLTPVWRMKPVSLFEVVILAPIYGLLAAMLVTICLGSGFLVMRWVFTHWQDDEEDQA